MAQFRVVVSDQVFPTTDIERGVLDEIDATLEIADGTRSGLLSVGADADAILNTYLPLDAATIAGLPRCRIIARYGIGVDNIDVEAATAAGVTVTNVPDYSVEEVAAHTVALILALIRRLPAADAVVRSGGWGLDELRPIRRISGLTFGLLGYGRIGQRVGRAIEAIGGQILVHDPFLPAGTTTPRLVDLEELVASSDVLSVHAPLTPATRGLIDAPRIAAMRPGAILVNTSRGGLVVLDAVIDALRSGHLAAAGLDVLEREPEDAARIAGVPNLLLTPHIAYYSEESLAESQRKAATQIVKVLTGGTPDYPVHR